MKRVIFFGTYNGDYPRNRLLLKWTAEAAAVVEVNERGRGVDKYFRLARSLMKLKNYDAVVIGFPGHLACIIARLVSRKPVIFDAFISMYDTYVFDRATVKPGSFGAWYYWCIDWLAFHAATMVVIDTNEHAKYLENEFGIPSERITVVPVVTDVGLFKPAPKAATEQKVIWWHGKFSRLHNVNYIMDVATLMRDEKNISFHFLGSGGDAKSIRSIIESRHLQNVILFPPVPYEQLANSIVTGDICLGVFGSSDKVDRVVPNKIFEYLSCGKPVVTRNSHAVQRMCAGMPIRFVDAQPKECRDAILELLRVPVDPEKTHKKVEEWYQKAQQTWKQLV